MTIDDGFAGRTLLLTWSGDAIGGAREKSITIGGEPIDVTDDGSSLNNSSGPNSRLAGET